MRGGDDRQNAAGGGQRWIGLHLAPPDRTACVPRRGRCRDTSANPTAGAATRRHRRNGCRSAERDARSAPALEGQRLHNLDPARSAELEGARVGGGENRVGPQQQALRAGPDAPENFEAAVFAHQVGIAVAREAAGAGAQRHQAGCRGGRPWASPGRGCRPGDTACPCAPPRTSARRCTGMSGGQRQVDHALVDALGVQVDLHFAAGSLDAFEDRAPELVAALGDAAFAVDAEGDAADRGAGAQQRGQGVAAIRPVGFGVESLDGVVGVRAVLPLVAVHPEAQLELEAVGGGLLADEAQGFQIAVALGVRQVHGAHVVAGHRKEERVGEEEIRVGDAAQEIVSDAEAEVEAVEAVFGEHGEVARPHLAVVEPGLVFHLAGEEALNAADGIGGRRAGGLRLGAEVTPRGGQGAGGQKEMAAVHNRIVLLTRRKCCGRSRPRSWKANRSIWS